MSLQACDACLRRTALVAHLAGAIEIARHEKRILRELLALADERLIAALAPGGAATSPSRPGAGTRTACAAAAAASGLAAVCRHEPGYPPRLLDLRDAPAVLFVARRPTR